MDKEEWLRPNTYNYPWFVHMDKEEVLDKTCMIIPDSCICTKKNDLD